ncbi:hypothetical protein V512_012200 [Mesotoga sp. Brook.08.105.5.1]|nr:hypothetical protein V512_012200 [Mesotoga sp. Brook.08.105.5.1]
MIEIYAMFECKFMPSRKNGRSEWAGGFLKASHDTRPSLAFAKASRITSRV